MHCVRWVLHLLEWAFSSFLPFNNILGNFYYFLAISDIKIGRSTWKLHLLSDSKPFPLLSLVQGLAGTFHFLDFVFFLSFRSPIRDRTKEWKVGVNVPFLTGIILTPFCWRLLLFCLTLTCHWWWHLCGRCKYAAHTAGTHSCKSRAHGLLNTQDSVQSKCSTCLQLLLASYSLGTFTQRVSLSSRLWARCLSSSFQSVLQCPLNQRYLIFAKPTGVSQGLHFLSPPASSLQSAFLPVGWRN